MSLTPYQIIVPLIALLAILYAWNLSLKQKKTIWESILWTLFWGVIGIVAFRPNILGYLTAITGIKDQVNAIFVTSIGILFFLVFYIIIRLEEVNQRQTKIVRSLALRDAGLEQKSDEQKDGK